MTTPPVMAYAHSIVRCRPEVAQRIQTYGCVVHIDGGDGEVVGEREDDDDKERPQYAVHIRRPAKEAIAHIERTRLEDHLWVVPI